MPAEVLVYDEIGYWGITAADFVRDLQGVTAKRMSLRISSPGGEVFEGIAIYNAIKNHPAHVTSQVDGLAASIASFIMLAADEVTIGDHAAVMIHDASGLCIGNAADMQQTADLLDKTSDNIADAYANKAGGTRADWRDTMRAETWYYGQEAVDAGLVDRMATPAASDKTTDHATNARTIAAMAAQFEWRNFDPTRLGARIVHEIKNGDAVRKSIEDDIPLIADTAVSPHDTACEEGTWDANANVSRLGSPLDLSIVKRVYGWYDGDQVENGEIVKGACKLPHHFVGTDGTPGAASAAGVRNALSRLPQTKGLSDAERATIERHLNAHLDKLPGHDDKSPDAPVATDQPDHPATSPATEPAQSAGAQGGPAVQLGAWLTGDLIAGAIQQAAEHDAPTNTAADQPAGSIAGYDADTFRTILLGELNNRPANAAPQADTVAGAIQQAVSQDGLVDVPVRTAANSADPPGSLDAGAISAILLEEITHRPAEPDLGSRPTTSRSISAAELADALREALQ
jgi:ATP-dependent protease ClpP protease subunit